MFSNEKKTGKSTPVKREDATTRDKDRLEKCNEKNMLMACKIPFREYVEMKNRFAEWKDLIRSRRVSISPTWSDFLRQIFRDFLSITDKRRRRKLAQEKIQYFTQNYVIIDEKKGEKNE